MNYIKHLTGFFERMIYEDSFNPTHISLYIALFQFWNIKRFANPIHISREETMRLSKICSKATYHKCMRALHEKNYIIYEPSFNPYRGSKVTIIQLELKDKDVQRTTRKHTSKKTRIERPLEQLVEPINEPSINQNKQGNQTNKLDKRMERKIQFSPPSLNEVVHFFEDQAFNSKEAESFFLYYEANGWIVGKNQMKNWQAAAKNWIIRSNKFKGNKYEKPMPNQLHVNQTNYAEKL